jgi:hypothetical protein
MVEHGGGGAGGVGEDDVPEFDRARERVRRGGAGGRERRLAQQQRHHLIRRAHRGRERGVDVAQGLDRGGQGLFVEEERDERAAGERAGEDFAPADEQDQSVDQIGQEHIEKLVGGIDARLGVLKREKRAEAAAIRGDGRPRRRERAQGRRAAQHFFRDPIRRRQLGLGGFGHAPVKRAVRARNRDDGGNRESGHRRQPPRREEHEAQYSYRLGEGADRDVDVERELVGDGRRVGREARRELPQLGRVVKRGLERQQPFKQARARPHVEAGAEGVEEAAAERGRRGRRGGRGDEAAEGCHESAALPRQRRFVQAAAGEGGDEGDADGGHGAGSERDGEEGGVGRRDACEDFDRGRRGQRGQRGASPIALVAVFVGQEGRLGAGGRARRGASAAQRARRETVPDRRDRARCQPGKQPGKANAVVGRADGGRGEEGDREEFGGEGRGVDAARHRLGRAASDRCQGRVRNHAHSRQGRQVGDRAAGRVGRRADARRAPRRRRQHERGRRVGGEQ